jgi:hypothetical protein
MPQSGHAQQDVDLLLLQLELLLEAIDLRPGGALGLPLRLAEILQLLAHPRQVLLPLRIGVSRPGCSGAVGIGAIGPRGLPDRSSRPGPPHDHREDGYDRPSDLQDMDSVPSGSR